MSEITDVDGYEVLEGCVSKNEPLFEHLGQKIELDDGRKIYCCMCSNCPVCSNAYFAHINRKGPFSLLKIKPYIKNGKYYYKSRINKDEREVGDGFINKLKALHQKHNSNLVIPVKA